MADAKIEVKVGAVSFTGEGTESWLSTELERFIKHVPDLAKVAPAPPASDPAKGGSGGGTASGAGAGTTLASFLSSKKATSQTRTFLLTAGWLASNGEEHLTTSAVTKALDKHKQGKLTNASACLADNISRGFCAKSTGREFYVTEEGRTEIA